MEKRLLSTAMSVIIAAGIALTGAPTASAATAMFWDTRACRAAVQTDVIAYSGDVTTRYRPGTFCMGSIGSSFVHAEFRPSGNLALYRGSTVIWTSKTNGRGATELQLRADGDIAILAGTRVIWSTGTGGHAGGTFFLSTSSSTGNLRLQLDGRPSALLWSTNGR